MPAGLVARQIDPVADRRGPRPQRESIDAVGRRSGVEHRHPLAYSPLAPVEEPDAPGDGEPGDLRRSRRPGGGEEAGQPSGGVQGLATVGLVTAVDHP